MDSKSIRYQNTRILVDSVGGISSFAERINKGQSQTSQFAGTNPIKGIGNKVAREIEEAFKKPHGWLDVLHHEENELLANSLNNPQLTKSNEELQSLIRSLNYLNAKGKLSSDLLTTLKTIVSLASNE